MARAPVEFIGRHTALSIIADRPEVWKRIPHLRENGGRAPALILAAGDRRRVYAAAKHLDDVVMVPEAAARLLGVPECPGLGRVAMAVGTYKGTPILVAETQMGAPAVQIIVSELLSGLTSTTYQTRKGRVALSRKVVVRVGTVGGIGAASRIRAGDIAVATHVVGATGAIAQTFGGAAFWTPDSARDFRRNWTRLGLGFTVGAGGYPRADCSPEVVSALCGAAEAVSERRTVACGDLTADSLYARTPIRALRRLSRTQHCETIEMELAAVAPVARARGALFGMVAAVVNVVGSPGSWLPAEIRAEAEDAAVRTALEAADHLAAGRPVDARA